MPQRREFDSPPLDAADLAADPIEQFHRWYREAEAAGVEEPHAMTLATTAPAARIVYLERADAAGFAFFTNYGSAKAGELEADPRVALLFAWLPQHRSVRVVGHAERLAAAASDAYFARRPRGAQIGAWASPQSAVLPDRAALEKRVAAADARFSDSAVVPRPPFWGGLRVVPESLEFWQGRPSRLHDRLRYTRAGNSWRVERLAP